LADIRWRNGFAVERKDHPTAIGMAVNSVTPFAAAVDEFRLQQEKFRFVEAESLVMLSSHQFFQELLLLAHAMSEMHEKSCTVNRNAQKVVRFFENY